MTAAGKLILRYEKFLYEPQRLDGLVICRVVFGLCLFFHYFSIISSIQILFGPDGLTGARFFADAAHAAHLSRWNLQSLQVLHVVNSPTGIWFAYALLLATSLCFAAGLFTRVTGMIALILHTLFHAQNEYAFWGWGDMIRPLMLYVILSRAGECYSLDVWRRLHRWNPTPAEKEAPAWPMRLMQIHVTTIYLMTAWARVDDPNWQDGSMLYGILTDPLFGRIASDWREFIGPIRILCYVAWFIELAAPITLWIRPYRRPTVIALLALHAGLEVFTMVGYWDFLMAAALCTFLFQTPSLRKPVND